MKFIFLATLLFSSLAYSEVISVSHLKSPSIKLEIERTAQKFGYNVVTYKERTVAENYTYGYVEINIPEFNKTYFEFLAYLFEITPAAVHNHNRSDQNISLTLSKNVDEKTLAQIFEALEKTGAHVFSARYDRIEIFIPHDRIEQFIQATHKMNTFHSYALLNQNRTYDQHYYKDLTSKGTKNVELLIPFRMNSDYILDYIQKQFPIQVVSRKTVNDQTVVVIKVENKEKYLTHFRKFLIVENQGVQSRILNDQAPTRGRILSSKSSFTFMPHNIMEYVIKYGYNKALDKMNSAALKMSKMGYRVLDVGISPEMGGGYIPYIDVQKENVIVDIEKFSKLGDLYIRDGHYPGPKNQVTVCSGLFL